jgi:hypothetical protein
MRRTGCEETQRYDVDGVANVDGRPDVKQFQSMVRKLLGSGSD